MTNLFYTKKTRIKVNIDHLFAWHETKAAIARLTPPWVDLKMVGHTGGIEKGTQVKFILKIFGIPFAWEAKHIEYEKNRLFRDKQTRGPFKTWIHTHEFEPVSENESIMKDHVEYQLPFGLLGKLFQRMPQRDLKRIFRYRHRVLKDDLENLPDAFQKKTILISGASGTIGQALVPFLETSGHRVIKLVRRSPLPENDELFWDPEKGILDLDDNLNIDAVINLNGLDISRGRWSKQQKEKIISSRTNPTVLLAQKIIQLKKKPAVFLSSSAIGYYGNRNETILTEKDISGDRFISKVCRKWEIASQKALHEGIRTVQLRIGIVLTPAGGALQRMIPAFLLGMGTKVSHGNQYMSWISMEDVLGAIHHILFDESISGPVNLTAPNPVTNSEFTRCLASVLRRPAFFTLPPFMVTLLWGQMGKETLLDSARVRPHKLIKSGYTFRFSKITAALKHSMGLE